MVAVLGGVRKPDEVDGEAEVLEEMHVGINEGE